MSEEMVEVQDAPEAFDDKPQKGKNKTLIIILIVAAVIILCCCCVAVAAIIIAASTGALEDLFSGLMPLLQVV